MTDITIKSVSVCSHREGSSKLLSPEGKARCEETISKLQETLFQGGLDATLDLTKLKSVIYPLMEGDEFQEGGAEALNHLLDNLLENKQAIPIHFTPKVFEWLRLPGTAYFLQREVESNAFRVNQLERLQRSREADKAFVHASEKKSALPIRGRIHGTFTPPWFGKSFIKIKNMGDNSEPFSLKILPHEDLSNAIEQWRRNLNGSTIKDTVTAAKFPGTTFDEGENGNPFFAPVTASAGLEIGLEGIKNFCYLEMCVGLGLTVRRTIQDVVYSTTSRQALFFIDPETNVNAQNNATILKTTFLLLPFSVVQLDRYALGALFHVRLFDLPLAFDLEPGITYTDNPVSTAQVTAEVHRNKGVISNVDVLHVERESLSALNFHFGFGVFIDPSLELFGAPDLHLYLGVKTYLHGSPLNHQFNFNRPWELAFQFGLEGDL